MRLNHIRCDGCGVDVRADDGAYRFWAKLTIDRSSAPQVPHADKVCEFDICPRCIDQANPTKWPREAETSDS